MPTTDAESALAAAVHCLRTDAMTAEVVTRLKAESIRCISLKGPGLVRWLYPDMSRTYRDSDLLVPEAEIPRAEALLEALGFVHLPLDDLPGDRPWHAHLWRLQAKNLGVDLHRTLIGCTEPPEVVWDEVTAHTETIDVQGAEVEVLNASGRALHVALHAAQDGRRLGKPIQDLERALARTPEETWVEAARLAQVVGAEESFGTGLRLLPAGRELADRMALRKTASLEVALRAAAAPQLALTLEWLSHRPSIFSKIAFALRKLFPPRAFIESWTPLARRGAFVLPLAYVWRLVWCIGRLPSALLILQRSRRAVRS
jgi:hypothetical protein